MPQIVPNWSTAPARLSILIINKQAIVKKKIETDHYKKCVLDNENHSVSINCIRNKKKTLTNFTLKQNKLALSNTDDKRVWDGITSKAYGHYSLKSV